MASGRSSPAPKSTSRNCSPNSRTRAIPTSPSNSPSCTPKRSSTSIPISPANSAKPPSRSEKHVQELFPQLKDPRYPNLPEQLTFLHAEEILDLYPDLPRKQRETAILQKYPAVFIIGIG